MHYLMDLLWKIRNILLNLYIYVENNRFRYFNILTILYKCVIVYIEHNLGKNGEI